MNDDANPKSETDLHAPRTSDLREIEPVPSGIRKAPLDAEWLEVLYDLALELPVTEGSRAVVRTVVDRLSRLFPGVAFGACLVEPEREEQIVEVRLPDGTTTLRGHDPSRLFAELIEERVFPLGGDFAGSTLHAAAEDAAVFDPAGPTIRVASRAGRLLESGLRQARAMERALEANSELRRLQAQVIQAEKLSTLGQIVAGVVHELNNPLTSIIAYSDYLKMKLAARADADDVERADRIGEAAQRILRFSRDLVAYARPSGDVPGPVAIHEVIDKAIIFCEHEFAESRVRVERRWYDGLPLVRGIAGQLTQVFVNLFTNAAHAMHGIGGRVVIFTHPGDGPDWVRIEVIDEGVGIDAENLDQIFEPFFTTKSEGRGTGLGLSIVRDIVMSHGGTLVARSVPRQGSTFVITLPVAVRPPTTRPPPPRAE